MITILLVSSCTEYDLEEVSLPKEANVCINITKQRTGKNLPYTRAAETDINNAIVLVYNASRIFEKSGDVTGSPQSVTLTLREGKKYIFVVANPSTALHAKLEASPAYTVLVDMLSEADDYNSGNLPPQGLLMSGKTEQTISAGTTNTVNIELTFCMTRIELYMRKASNDVENITVASVSLRNARSLGYLFKEDGYTTTVTNTVNLKNTQISSYTAGSDGTLIGIQYSYPTFGATDIAFNITLKHANATKTDTYTVYLNPKNSSAQGSSLERNKQYKVLVTFSKDENGNLKVSSYTQIDTNFTIG